MTLCLFDTATSDLREFVPLTPGKVGVYVCGATVQGGPHIGHLRTAISFDILTRWLRFEGYQVTHIQNVTDIDDKILVKASQADVPYWAWALKYEREFQRAYEAVGVEPPTYEPRATGHMTDMIEMLALLIERGHAYVTTPGNVFFDVGSFPHYGSLTHQKPEDMASSEDGDDYGKRDPRDFALWKAAKVGEPAWDTPFGRGRPGWHLECSAMARRYLGDAFDIHGGAIDLRFPHHENERAQSRAAGYDFANFWLHAGWVTQAGAKMSKSLGNSLSAASILEQHPGVVLRYALMGAHYRSMLEFGPTTMADVGPAWERIAGFMRRAQERLGAPDIADVDVPAAFRDAMNDDLNVPEALAVIHDHTRLGNMALADAELAEAATQHALVKTMVGVLGLDMAGQQSNTDNRLYQALEALVGDALAARTAARKARDYAAADAIRGRLIAAGIVVEDSPAGPRWTLEEGE